jgi:hypothetical protein
MTMTPSPDTIINNYCVYRVITKEKVGFKTLYLLNGTSYKAARQLKVTDVISNILKNKKYHKCSMFPPWVTYITHKYIHIHITKC